MSDLKLRASQALRCISKVSLFWYCILDKKRAFILSASTNKKSLHLFMTYSADYWVAVCVETALIPIFCLVLLLDVIYEHMHQNTEHVPTACNHPLMIIICVILKLMRQLDCLFSSKSAYYSYIWRTMWLKTEE